MDATPETDATPGPRARMAVFVLDGNRLVHPMYAYLVDAPDTMDAGDRSASSVIIDAMMFGVVSRMERPDGDAGWVEYPVSLDGMVSFPHVKVDLTSRMFEHGGCTMMCIAGPMYDKVVAEAQAEAAAVD